MNIIPIKLAWQALFQRKTRTVLTITGLSIGIAVVIAIMAAGRGLDYMVKSQLEAFSPNTINIETKVPSAKKTSTDNAFGQSTGITITTIKEKDLADIRRHPNIVSAYGWQIGQAVVKYEERNKTVTLMGEGYNLQEVEKINLSEGRMFTAEEEGGLAQVAVLGSAVKETLFGEDSATGKFISVKGKSFRVIGVAEKRGATFGMDMDTVLILPVTTLQKKILGVDYFRSIIAKMRDNKQSAATVADIEEIMRTNHDITDPNKDDFAVNTMEEAAKMLSSVVNGITFLLVALVCVSLVVGGVGIMNIMYVSVTERTFEIGLRKAVGAKSKDILWQFLSEAVLLTLGGGAAGIVFGAIFAGLVYWIAISYNFVWLYSIPLSSILLAVGFSALVGLFFGLYPAKRAAQLDPIDALRRE